MMRMKNVNQSLLLIIVLVSTIGAEEVIYATVGERVTLASKSDQAQYVYWYLGKQDGHQLAWLNHLGGRGTSDDQKWKSRLSLSGASLVITDFQPDFFGTFVCKTTSSDSVTVYKVIQVNVDVKPDSLLLDGDILSLTCNLNSTSQVQNKPSIYWLNPRGERERNDQVNINVPATSQHHGQWFCVVKDRNNEKKFPVSVSVVGFKSVSSHQYTAVDTSLTIPCSITSGITWEQILKMEPEELRWDFVPKLSSGAISDKVRLFYFDLEKKVWMRDQGKGLKLVSPDKKENLSLTKSKAKVEDRGFYTCSLKIKDRRTLKNTVDVDVLQITAQPGTELIYGQQVNLSCSAGDPLPNDMTLNWTRPETSSPYVHYPSHITIPEVRKGDSGRWRCELWRGDNKLTSAEILLKTEPRLSVWMLVIICSAAVIFLLLLVLVFIHYRRRKQRMRLLRHQLCQCKNPKPKGFYRT